MKATLTQKHRFLSRKDEDISRKIHIYGPTHQTKTIFHLKLHRATDLPDKSRERENFTGIARAYIQVYIHADEAARAMSNELDRKWVTAALTLPTQWRTHIYRHIYKRCTLHTNILVRMQLYTPD